MTTLQREYEENQEGAEKMILILVQARNLLILEDSAKSGSHKKSYSVYVAKRYR
jgi:hypothetical protein